MMMKKAKVIKQQPRLYLVGRPKQKQVDVVGKFAFAKGIKLFKEMHHKHKFVIFTTSPGWNSSTYWGHWVGWSDYDTARRCWRCYVRRVYKKTLLGKRGYSNRLRIAKKLARAFERAARESAGIGAELGGLYGGVPPSAINLLANPAPEINQCFRDYLPCDLGLEMDMEFSYWWMGEGDAEIAGKKTASMGEW